MQLRSSYDYARCYIEKSNFYLADRHIERAMKIFPSSAALQLLSAKCLAVSEDLTAADEILKKFYDDKNYVFEKGEILYYSGRLDESFTMLNGPIEDVCDQNRAAVMKEKIIYLKNFLQQVDGSKMDDKCCLELLYTFNIDDIPPIIWRDQLIKRYSINKKVSPKKNNHLS
jgi:tetratricopeptide (TPR) repeat protein